MHQFKQKAVLATLLIACTMHLQALEMKLEINGGDIITPAIEQLKKVPMAIGKFVEKAEELRVPCLWQYQDGKIATTYINPVILATAGAAGALSIVCFKGAWDEYQDSKEKALEAATLGGMFAFITYAFLYGGAHKSA